MLPVHQQSDGRVRASEHVEDSHVREHGENDGGYTSAQHVRDKLAVRFTQERKFTWRDKKGAYSVTQFL